MIYTPEQLAESGTEHGHQAAFFCECAQRARQSPLWWLPFAIPNGGLRDKATAARLKAEGVKSGVPDIFVPVARWKCHGLFLEMKLPFAVASDVSPFQRGWLKELDKQGYATAIGLGWQHAIEIVENYLFGMDAKRNTSGIVIVQQIPEIKGGEHGG
jgi:hypothetical protein